MKLLRYSFVGGVAAAVDLGIFIVGVRVLEFAWFFVAISSFILATAVNYLLSIRCLFDSGVRFRTRTEVSLVFLVSGIGLVVTQSVLWLLIETAGIEEVVSKCLATGTVFAWNYAARSRYIFRGPQ